MIGVEIAVEGMERLLPALDRRDADAGAAIERSLLRLALLIERLAKDKYVPVVTGRLKSSIGGQMPPRPMRPSDAVFRAGWRGPEFEVLVGSNVVYAAVIEFGRRSRRSGRRGSKAARELRADIARSRRRRTGNGRHGPFLRPALTEAIPNAMPVLRREFVGFR